MVRRISTDPSVVRSPARAPVRAPITAPTPAPSPQPRPIQPPATKGESAWMAEMLFEAGFDPRLQTPHPGPSEGPGSPKGPGFTRGELLAASAEAPAGEIPRSVAQYRALLSRMFDDKADTASEDMLEEPVLQSMRAVWIPGRPEVNRKVALEFMRYFIPKLGEAYGYKPCPVEFDDTQSGGYNGLYDIRHDRIYLPHKALNGTFAEFIDVLVHEQMHCLQERLIGRLHLNKGGVPLTPDERAIATYWRNEQPKYRSAMANGAEMSPETRKRYREIGQEYHSITTGADISTRLTRS